MRHLTKTDLIVGTIGTLISLSAAGPIGIFFGLGFFGTAFLISIISRNSSGKSE